MDSISIANGYREIHEIYGNVKVNYAPCKCVGQLKGATDYILGNMEQQRKEGII